MTLRAMEKSYITTSLHSTSYPFASGKAEPSVFYKAAPSWFGKAMLSIVCQCEKAVWEVCQNSLILKKSQSPDFHKPGLCYF